MDMRMASQAGMVTAFLMREKGRGRGRGQVGERNRAEINGWEEDIRMSNT